ncbi:MAG: hypothetical protein AAFV19_04355 [Pseudomonadota bacterium]
MRRLSCAAMMLCLLVVPPVKADTPTLRIAGAMVEGPEGTPLATATGVAGDPGQATYITSASVAGTDGLCLRTWSDGLCLPVAPGSIAPVAGLPTMVTVGVPFDQQDMLRKFADPALNVQLEIDDFDPARDRPEVALMTQNGFGGWEIPIEPVTVAGQIDGGFTIRSAVLNDRSIGAPVSHAERGLVGVITAVDPAGGIARVTGMTTLTDRLVASGIAVPPEMRPKARQAGELPRAVEAEIGRMFVFQDNSTIPAGLWGFYGASNGTGFSDSFVTEVSYSVFEVDLSGPRGRLIAGGDKTVPLVLTGMPLEAPFRGTAPDHVATCVVHPTPSSGGRPAMVLQFWRAVPERFDRTTGNKSYDEAAPLLTAWADGASPCADRLAVLGPDRIAALSGRIPSGATAAATGSSTAQPAVASPPAQPKPSQSWQWTSIQAGDTLNVSGHDGSVRANLVCYQQNGRVIAGINLTGPILDPIRPRDLRSGQLVFSVGGQHFSTRVSRVADQLGIEAVPDGAALIKALPAVDKIVVSWSDASGAMPLGAVDLDGAQTHIAALIDACGLVAPRPAQPSTKVETPVVEVQPTSPPAKDGWTEGPAWDATGLPAWDLSIVGGRTLTLGCTESSELVVAVSPGLGVSGFQIGDRKAYETGRQGKTSFAYFDGDDIRLLETGAAIVFRVIGAPFEIPAPANLRESRSIAACSG